MNFLAPLAFALSLLAIPIILLYMLRLRRREVQVSSTLLWQQLLRDREANAPWQKLRRNLLLFLQLLILIGLVITLARPYIEVPTVTSGRTALLIDASASMNATDVSPNRFEVARQQALDIVNSLGEQDTVAIVRVAEGPEMIQSYTNDRELLRAAINRLRVSTAAADWNAALTLAAAGAQGAEKFGIVIIGDGGLTPGLTTNAYGEVRFIPVGADSENVAISALSTGTDLAKGPQIYARLSNYGAQTAQVIFSVKLDGNLFNASPYTVPPNSFTDVVVTGLPKQFQRVETNLTRPTGATVPDYLPLDDTAWTVYNPTSAGKAVIYSKGNRFIEQGLASLPDWQVLRGDPSRGISTVEKYDLYVFDGWLPGELPDANTLIINPPANMTITAMGETLLTIGGLTRRTKITGVRPDDPRTRYLEFNDVNVLEYKRVTPPDWAVSLVEAEDGPLVLAGDFNGRRISLVTFDLFNSDLPLKIAWPILLANLTEWYKAPRAIQIESALRPGQTVPIRPTTDATDIRVILPDGDTRTYRVEQPILIYSDTAQNGVYNVEVLKGEEVLQREYFAINLFDANESALAVRTPTLNPGNANAVPQQEIGQREYWPWIALVAVAILALEWYAYHRRLQAPRLRLAGRFARPGKRVS